MQDIVWLVLFVGLCALVMKLCLRPVTIFEFERGLKYARGRYKGLLSPGLYWIIPQLAMIRTVDTRPTFVSITGQEVLSADGVSLKVSLAAKYQVVDPEAAINSIDDYQAALYLELQLGLRHLMSGAPIDEILNQRQTLGHQLLTRTAARAESMGLRLLEVEIKDVMFPGDLKKIFTQVVKARQEGLAALEKARGETAALRNLANAAHLVERTPALLHLRLLQTLGQTPGNTVVLGMPSPGTPFPIHSPGVSERDVPPSTPETAV